MEGGVLRYSGTAAELRERPEWLHSAYLLRGSEVEASAVLDGTVPDGGGANVPASPDREDDAR